MKVLTYNILTGGSDGRLSIIKDVVREVNPDVVCLQETNGFDVDNNQVLCAFGRELGFPYYALAKCGTAGKDYSVATFTRKSVWSESLPGFRHAGLLTHFDSGVVLCNVLLSSKSDDERLQELSGIVDLLEGKDALFVGDHNMLSPFDEYDAALPGTFNEQQSARFVYHGKLDFRAAGFLTCFGFRDVAQLLGDVKRQPLLFQSEVARTRIMAAMAGVDDNEMHRPGHTAEPLPGRARPGHPSAGAARHEKGCRGPGAQEAGDPHSEWHQHASTRERRHHHVPMIDRANLTHPVARWILKGVRRAIMSKCRSAWSNSQS